MLIVCPSCATAFRVTKDVLGDSGRQVRCAQCRTVWLATVDQAVEEKVGAEAETPPPAPEPPPEPSPADDADWGAAFAEEEAAKKAESPEPAVPEAESPSLQPDLDDTLPAAKPAKTPEARALAGTLASTAARRRRLTATGKPLKRGFSLSLPAILLMLGVAVIATFMLGREQVVRTVPDAAGIYERLGMPVNLRGIDFRDVKGANEIVDGVVVLVVEGMLVNITPRAVDLPRLRLAVRDAAGKEIYTWTATPPKPRLEGGEQVSFRSRLASPPPDGASVEVRFFTRADAGGR